VIILVSKKLLDFALRALIQTIAQNRPDLGTRDLALKVRSTGTGPELTALLSIKGRNLELEGVLPEPLDGAVPIRDDSVYFWPRKFCDCITERFTPVLESRVPKY